MEQASLISLVLITCCTLALGAFSLLQRCRMFPQRALALAAALPGGTLLGVSWPFPHSLAQSSASSLSLQAFTLPGGPWLSSLFFLVHISS